LNRLRSEPAVPLDRSVDWRILCQRQMRPVLAPTLVQSEAPTGDHSAAADCWVARAEVLWLRQFSVDKH